MGHRNYSAFACSVRCIGCSGIPLSGDGGYVYDATSLPLGNQFFGGALHTEEYAFGVDLVDAIPVLLLNFHDVQVFSDSGVIYYNIDAAKSVLRLLEHSVNVCHVPHVRW